MTPFEDLCVRLGVNFHVEVIYWDDEEPAKREAPWHLVVHWFGCPAAARDAWHAAQAGLRSLRPNRICVAEVFAASLGHAALAAWEQPALSAAAQRPDAITGWTYNEEHDRLDPILEEGG